MHTVDRTEMPFSLIPFGIYLLFKISKHCHYNEINRPTESWADFHFIYLETRERSNNAWTVKHEQCKGSSESFLVIYMHTQTQSSRLSAVNRLTVINFYDIWRNVAHSTAHHITSERSTTQTSGCNSNKQQQCHWPFKDHMLFPRDFNLNLTFSLSRCVFLEIGL